MNLENLNLVELNAQEVIEVEGGFWEYVIGALVGAAFTQDLDRLKDAWNHGWNAGAQP